MLQVFRDTCTLDGGGVQHARDMNAHLVTMDGGDHGTAIQGGITTVDTAITDCLLAGATTVTRAPEEPITAPL
ncbi:hypothetical protein M2280_001159 [Prescottella agglutinans]|uniref:Peptidase S33 tripeptidyl aminopeptidase-like C-terminal domain-containing protein n=1 Tax=Prescottella agglutinans TaxID=1644129 RepID=A0ABT6M7S4_9NOCA|nr:hypothetical protein [Prescottella agglutinans]